MSVQTTNTQAIIPDTARCKGCGYCLRGLDVFRCPECGRGFDPTDPRTMRRPILPVRVAKHLAQSQLFRWMQLGFVATLLIAIMPMRNMHFWEHLHIALPSFVLGWFLWLIVMTATWTSLKLITPKWKRWFTRVSALLLLGIPLSWSVGYGECGHGKFVYIGPEILIVPTVGFDCGARHAIRLVWDPLVGRQDYSAEIHDSPDMVAQTPYIIGELIAFPVIATLIFFAARTKEST